MQGLAQASEELIWMWSLLKELQVKTEGMLVIMYDNKNAKNLAQNLVQYQ